MKSTKNHLPIVLMAALAVVLVAGAMAQQAATDKAVDPVCGMTVVKANAKATYDYKGTTYYFCNTGCKEAFAKEPDKFLKAEQAKAPAADMGHMGMMHGQQMAEAPKAEGEAMACCPNCPMMARGKMMYGRMGRMGMMHGGQMGRGMGMGMGQGMGMACGPDCPLMGKDVEIAVEKTKDGAVLKFSSKNAETVKAIQEHLTEHVASMKKMKEAAAKAPEAGACANCPMMKK
jgi:YHS domain-containing protein